MSKILALDQSSRITGWAIFDNGKLVNYGKFSAEVVGANIGDRLEFIRNKIRKLIEDNQVEEVIMEDIQMQGNIVNNVQTFKVLAEVFGVVSELLVEMKIPQSAVLASSWKSALGIKGRARAEQKQNAQKLIAKIYNISVIQDIADAICIGLAFLQNDKENHEEKGAW